MTFHPLPPLYKNGKVQPPKHLAPPIYKGGKVQTPNAPVGSNLTPQQELNVRAIQQQLVREGYKINITGHLDTLTKSALKDYLQPNAQHPLSDALQKALGGTGEEQLHRGTTTFDTGGARNPQAWNAAHVPTPKLTPAQVAANHADTRLRRGTDVGRTNEPLPVNGQGSSRPTAPAAGNTGTIDYSGLGATSTGRMLPTSLAQFGQMISPSTAQDIAGAQYDPQIAAAALQLKLDPGQFAQDIKDITSWYGQVGAAQKTAQAQVASMGGSGTASIGDAAAALAASLGGSANQGAHDIAQSGDIAKGTQAALAQAANTYEANIGPLLAAEGAEQKVNQQNKDATQLLTDQQALAALQSSRGEAAQAALAQITGQNNSLAQARAQMAASILQGNNALSQQDFSNQLALENAIAAAQSMGLDAQYKQAQIAKEAADAQTATRKANAPLFARNNPYLAASADVKNKAFNEALSALYDPTTKAKLHLTPQQAWGRIAGVYRGYGFTPAPGTPSYGAAQNVLNTWSTAG